MVESLISLPLFHRHDGGLADTECLETDLRHFQLFAWRLYTHLHGNSSVAFHGCAADSLALRTGRPANRLVFFHYFPPTPARCPSVLRLSQRRHLFNKIASRSALVASTQHYGLSQLNQRRRMRSGSPDAAPSTLSSSLKTQALIDLSTEGTSPPMGHPAPERVAQPRLSPVSRHLASNQASNSSVVFTVHIAHQYNLWFIF